MSEAILAAAVIVGTALFFLFVIILVASWQASNDWAEEIHGFCSIHGKRRDLCIHRIGEPQGYRVSRALHYAQRWFR